MRGSLVLVAIALVGAGCARPDDVARWPILGGATTILGPADLTARGIAWSGSGARDDPIDVEGWTLASDATDFALALQDPQRWYVLRGLDVDAFGAGIQVAAAGVEIADTRIRVGHGTALHVIGDGVRLTNVSLEGSSIWGLLLNARGARVSDLRVASDAPVGIGVESRGGGRSTFEHVTIATRAACMALDGDGNAVRRSAFDGCADGVAFASATRGNVVAGNAFGPGVGVRAPGGDNAWDGNHWADGAPALDRAPLAARPADAGARG